MSERPEAGLVTSVNLRGPEIGFCQHPEDAASLPEWVHVITVPGVKLIQVNVKQPKCLRLPQKYPAQTSAVGCVGDGLLGHGGHWAGHSCTMQGCLP